MRDFVLVGGSRDGQRITLEVPCQTLKIQVTRNIAMHAAPPDTGADVELYFLRELEGRNQTELVYAIQGMNVNAVLAKLVDSYGRR